MEDDPDRVRQYEHPKAAKHCGNVGRLQNGGRNQTGDSNGRQPEREREIWTYCFQCTYCKEFHKNIICILNRYHLWVILKPNLRYIVTSWYLVLV